MNLVNSKRLLPLVSLLVLLMMAAPAWAQEAAPEAAPPAAQIPTGGSTLMLLAGLGAIFLVAVIWLARERALEKPDES